MNKKTIGLLSAISLILLVGLQVISNWYYLNFIFAFDFLAGVPFLLTLVVDLVLAVVLLTSKLNKPVLIMLGVRILPELIYLLRAATFGNILSFLASVALFAFGFALAGQGLVKADLSKAKELASKLFFVPAAIRLVVCLISIIPTILYVSIYGYLSVLFQVAICISVAMFLKEEDEPVATKTTQATGYSDYATDEKGDGYIGLGLHIVLCLIIPGIWNLIWTYRTTKYLNKAPGAQYYSPVKKLLLYMFIPFYSIYWFYRHGERIDSFCKSKGITGTNMATLGLVLGIFLPIVAVILMQDKINTLCTISEPVKASNDKNDELRRLKSLLDDGIITQEDFDAKKKELLGL